MKKISLFILTILTILGFTSNVEAYSYSSITANKSGEKYEYVSGLPIYYNTANGYNIYVLNSDTYFDTYTNLTDPVEVSDGFSYIINNNNVTSSSYRNYYIAQVAILWYQDYLNNNDANIPLNIKNIIKNATGDTVSYNINKLVNNAKTYSNNESIKFIDKNITFTRNDNYYYSNVINVETYNLRSTPSVRLYNAPTSATIVNNTIVSNGTGSFQIRIPASSFNSITEKDFELYITGSTNNTKLYKYTNYGSTPVIYSRSVSNNYKNVEASIPVHISGIDRTNIRIHILNSDDEYLRNLKYYIYSGDCTKSTCYTDNLITSFTTNSNYISLNNTLNAGTYTLVNKSSNNNYNLPNKTKFVIENVTSIQDVTVKEGMYYEDDDTLNDSNRRINIVNKLNDYNNEIKIYTTSNYLQTSYRSSETNKSIYLTEGTYYIVDSKNKIDKLYFKVTSDGRLQIKYNNDYVFADYITLDRDDYNDSLTDKDSVIYDEDSDTYYVDGIDEVIIEQNVNTEIEWLSNIIDCPITSLNETIKYVVGACIIALGSYFLIKNVKRTKNNN